MADEKESYSREEHVAILAARVTAETETITADRDRLKAENDDLRGKLDVADAAKLAAEQAKATVETDFETFKTETAEREAAAGRKDARIAAVQEKAKHLTDDWFTDERVERIIAMKDEDFDVYVSDLASVVPAGEDGAKLREVPRETAMKGSQVVKDDGTPKESAGRAFILQRYQAPAEKQGV